MLTTKGGPPAGTPELKALAPTMDHRAVEVEELEDAAGRRRKPAATRRISIFGLGYVGAVSMACLARDGHQVIGVDIDHRKLDLIRARKSPILEEGIQELMRDVVDSGRVTVTDDAARAVRESEVSFICVGTPSAANGSQDLTAILRLAEQIGAALRDKREFHTVVVRSTVLPGTLEDHIGPILEKESGKRSGVDFGLAFQPEFLREGSSIRDYDEPPFTVVGANHAYPVDRLRALFGHLPCPFHVSSIRAAEMMKLACNNFHALKITFANETARLCDALRVDPFEVMRLFCEDTHLNISKAYLRPGYAFGGSCLPKDLRATMYMAKQRDVELPMLGGILGSNRIHVDRAADKLLATGKRRIGIVGLSFKAGTDDLRESPMVTLAEHLIGKGLALLVYDPDVQLSRLLGANKRYIEQHLPHIGNLLRADLPAIVDASDVLVVGAADAATLERLRSLVRRDQTLLDLVRIPDAAAWPCVVEGLCW